MKSLKNKFVLLLLLAVSFFFQIDSVHAATISRIQKGTATMASGTNNLNVTITGIDLTKSFLVFSVNVNSNRTGRSQIGGGLTTSTEINFQRFDAGGSPAAIIEWQVFEFSAGVTVQRGVTAGVSDAGINIPITAVSLTNAFATVNVEKDGFTYGEDDFVTADLTSTTNLFLDREPGGMNPQSAFWQVIEWDDATVQKIVTTLPNGSDSLAVTLGTMVDKDKAMVIGSHRISGNVNADDFPVTELVDGNTVSFSRVGTERNCAFVCYVVEFSDDTDVIHGSIRMTAAESSISTTICSVLPSMSGIIPPTHSFRVGANCESSDDDAGVSYATFELTSGTSVTATRAASGEAAIFPFQVLEFSPSVPSGCIPTEPGASTPRTFGLCSAVLPVELINFDVNKTNENSASITWQTGSEIDNDFFEVQRSFDAINFEIIETIKGAGNSSFLLNYGTVDNNLRPGITYYRLKQIDFDGAFEYSDIRSVQCEGEGNSIVIFPNPANNEVFVSGTINELNALKLYNSLGQELQIKIEGEGTQKMIDLTDLPSGFYYIKSLNDTKKLIKR